MDGFQLIKQGAEAKIYRGTYLEKPTIAKERFRKTYRHPDLDSHLTKERIKAECRAIIRCKAVGIYTPTLYLIDLKRNIVFMEYFQHSITVKEYIFKASDDQLGRLSYDIGKYLAKMHFSNIIHGDLTTSNMLLVHKCNKDVFFESYDDLKLLFIDFGLAHIETSAEDKAVDLYVLERALLSTHSIAEQIFPIILKAYKEQYKKGIKEIIAKLEEVRARGRKRTMVG